ncbi:MAG TPA: bile acid:sodium symporter, partial [Steroidobacteraceae bacterium]|nr:bile acid:sodium symporter [Steroidobacteraceae bacterium]
MSRFLPDPFILALLGTVALATLLPADGAAATQVGYVATAAVVLLFFLHGVRLPRENLVAALVHWRLHLVILVTTFVLFPLFGAALARLFPGLLPAGLWAGVLFLCALPSTVQTSIAYTSMAKGNVAASVASAAASNLLGIALTPLIAGLLLHTQGGAVPLSGIWKVVLQLLLPFVVGHLLRPWLGDWAARQRKLLTYSDRLTILLSVYSAFSAAVIAGIWSKVPVLT